MNVSRDRLSVIGKLIGIYREERRGNTQNSFTLKKFCEGICSINTLKNIEAGGLSRSEDVYIELLDKLDLKFGEFPVIDKEIDKLIESIFKDIEFFHIQSLAHECKRGIRLLENVKEYVYYNEIYCILKDLYEYYHSDILIDDERIFVYKNLLNNEVFVWGDIFKVLLFAKLKTESISDIDNYYNLINSLDLLHTNLNCVKLSLLHYYFVSGDYLKMNDMISELELIFIKTKNYVRLIDVYNHAIIILSYISNQSLDYYIDKIKKIIDERDIPDIKVFELYSNIASYFHHRKNYEEAYKYYREMLNIYDGNYIPHLLYYADCQNRIYGKVNMPSVEKEVFSGFPVELKVMYKYFTLGEDVPDFVKQNYIMKRILPKLKNEVHVEIFRFELSKLVNRTGNYKLLHDYESYINKKLS
ncbi:hypothetical protein MKC54_08320 [[Clostridium] innocuum]|nr:hypothetical protein [[Clostridium] innocuum]MCR0576887.1 hypothetical protein [[Clostridium] innocuum]